MRELSNSACTAVPGALGLTQPLFEGCDVGYLDMGTNTGTRIGALYAPALPKGAGAVQTHGQELSLIHI